MESNMPPVHPGAILREDILKEMKKKKEILF